MFSGCFLLVLGFLPLGLGYCAISRMDVRPLEDWHGGFTGQFPGCSETLDQGVSLDTHCGEQGKNQIGALSSDWVSSLTASGEGHRGIVHIPTPMNAWAMSSGWVV